MKSPDKFANLLFILFILVWIILAFNPLYFDAWKMENWLTLPFIILLILLHKWFKLSNLSYTMLFSFMILHIIGSHYTYAEVPFGFWLQSLLGLTRNHYDRIVHFAFGLLFAYPIREISKRIGNLKGIWAIWIPIELILALSGIYEILEWGVAVIFGGDLGIAYLGSQGDIWDAQKDMVLAGIGALITMIVTSLTIIYYNSHYFWSEFKESLTIKQKDSIDEITLLKLKSFKR
jgi:putative membrane protein